jgi:hypothetical protein
MYTSEQLLAGQVANLCVVRVLLPLPTGPTSGSCPRVPASSRRRCDMIAYNLLSVASRSIPSCAFVRTMAISAASIEAKLKEQLSANSVVSGTSGKHTRSRDSKCAKRSAMSRYMDFCIYLSLALTTYTVVRCRRLWTPAVAVGLRFQWRCDEAKVPDVD